MSIITLLAWPDNERGQAAFAFDHAREHERITDAMHQPNLFNLAHYLLDPIASTGMGGSALWSMNHQQAHDDASSYFDVKPSLPMIDTPAQEAGPFQWFLFINSQEHNALSLAALRSGFAS